MDAAGASAQDAVQVTVTVATDPHFDQVVLLTHLEGQDGATDAMDESNSNHDLVFNGNAQLDTAQSKFGASSALFDGLPESRVTASDSDDWAFGSGEFTAEAWVQFNDVSDYQAIMGHWRVSDDERSWLMDFSGPSQLRFQYSTNGSNFTTIGANWSPTVGTWYHIAVDRDANSTLRLYVDGNVIINTALSSAFHDSNADFYFGNQFHGWIDELRVTKGVARYAGPFANPNTPPTFDHVVLLTHLEGQDGATDATDESDSNHDLVFNGNAQLDTSQSKFGASSALFDGLPESRVTAADSDDWAFGSGEFTAEAWVQFNDVSDYQAIMGHWRVSDDERSWLVDFSGPSQLRFQYSTNGSDFTTIGANWAPSVGTWYHIAVDRDANSTLRLYVDGNVIINTALSSAFHDSIADFYFGNQFHGWIDELRVTQGAAQYAGPFTPPTQPFPDGSANLVGVPDVTGLDAVNAEVDIVNAGLTVGTTTTASSESVPIDFVISQNPIAGTMIGEGNPVDLVISSGPATALVPDVVGLDQASAEASILSSGFVIDNVTTANSDTVPAGHVISQNPAGGTWAAQGSSVDLEVSLGPATETMHVGDMDGQAKKAGKNGWKAIVTINVHDSADAPVSGSVVSGVWSGAISNPDSCTTNGQGQCKSDQRCIGRRHECEFYN